MTTNLVLDPLPTACRPARAGGWLPIGLLALACLVHVPSHGQRPAVVQPKLGEMAGSFTWGEIALLPDWCIDSQGGIYGGPEGAAYTNKSPRAGHWVALMGRDFWHMHHYCYALRDLMRAKAPGADAKRRAYLYERAKNDLTYVIVNCGPQMPLLPEVYLKLGEVLIYLGDKGGAEAAFEKSRTIKPDYWPAYVASADALIQAKQFDAARRLVEEGLSHSPNQPELKQRLQRLSGGATPATSSRPASRAS